HSPACGRAGEGEVRRGGIGLGAVAAGGVHPVLLDQVIASAEKHVGQGAVGSVIGSAERPGTLVGVLLAVGVVPRVQIRVGDGFFQFMDEDGCHPVGAGGAVGAD